MKGIVGDVNQFIGSHGKSNDYIHKQIQRVGIRLLQIPLPFGDYCKYTVAFEDTVIRRGDKLKKADLVGDIKVSIDVKKGIDEVVMNICGKSHNRFRDEAILAQKCGCKLIVLIIDDGGYLDKKKTVYNEPCRSVDDVFKWKNKRAFIWRNGKQLYPNCTKGSTVAKAMLSMADKYGIQWEFCGSKEVGKRIVELLGDNKQCLMN